MKFATQTINDVQHEFIKVYKTELEKATNGRMQVGVYPASQLGGQQRQTEGLRLGTIEAAIGPGELFAGADPRFGGLALAGLFNDNEHTRRVMALPEVRKASPTSPAREICCCWRSTSMVRRPSYSRPR